MIHGIYVKKNPKNKWHLFSVVSSQELASQDVLMAHKKCISEGYDNAEVAIKIFDSGFYIPEFLNDVQNQKILFN